jgi:hypothetical protein
MSFFGGSMPEVSKNKGLSVKGKYVYNISVMERI